MALQKAVKSEGFPKSFKFLAKGDTLKGYYQGKSDKVILGRPAVEHLYKTKDGLVTVLGQANILKQLADNSVEVGTYVEITFSGQMRKLKNGNTMKVYDVAFYRDNMDLEVGSLESEEIVDAEEELLDEELADEVAPPPPVAPSRPASVPTPERTARMQALLRGKKTGI